MYTALFYDLFTYISEESKETTNNMIHLDNLNPTGFTTNQQHCDMQLPLNTDIILERK